MAKPKWIIGAGLTIAVSVVVAGYWVLQPAPGVTIANCKRVHQGMSLAHVEGVLGKPREKLVSRAETPQHWFGYWDADAIDVMILFSMEDTVLGGSWMEWDDHDHHGGIDHKIMPPPSLWDRVTSPKDW